MSSNFDTYAGLRSAIYLWLDCTSGDIDTSIMDDCVRIAQRCIDKGKTIQGGSRSIFIPPVRCRQNEKTLSVALSNGVAAVPSDYLEMKQAYMISSGVTLKLDRVETDVLYRQYPVRANNGDAALFARDGANFVFGPVPSSGTLQGTYYCSFPYVTETTLSLTNSLSADYNSLYAAMPEMFLFGAAIEAEPLLYREGRAAVWLQKYISCVESLNTTDAKERLSGSALRVRNA